MDAKETTAEVLERMEEQAEQLRVFACQSGEGLAIFRIATQHLADIRELRERLKRLNELGITEEEAAPLKDSDVSDWSR